MSKQLTSHFSLEEMTRSATAKRLRIANVPSQEQVENLKHLCENVLEPLRRHLGRPVIINSGYRSVRLNNAVGGAPASQHLRGEAADIRVANRQELLDVMHFIMQETDFDQLIWERNSHGTEWVHVSYTSRRTNRRQVLNGIKKP